MAEIQKIEFSTEDLASMDKVAGFDRQSTVVEEVIEETNPEQIIQTQADETLVITTEEQPVVETTEAPVEAATEEPQLIIQEPEPEPIVEQQPEVVPTKVKAKAYTNSLVAALNKYCASVENPDPLAFIQAYQANYDNLDPVEVIRQEIVSDPFNKGLRQSAINRLLNERLSKFDLESDDPEERADALDLLKREADIVKARMIKNGKEFVSQYESDLEIEVEAALPETKTGPTEEEIQAWREAKTKEYLPEVTKFVKNGVISIQDKDGVINIPAADAQEYVNALLDPVGFIQSVALNPDGTPNYGKWIQIVTAAKNSLAYQSTMIKHGIALGQQKITGKIKNEAPLGQSRPVIEASDKIITPKENMPEFLKAVENIRPWRGN
jgi:hypothetical protein